MGAPTVKLSGIVKGYGGAPVIDGVDLSLFPGEAHALLGENGAGKSTLVKILAGVHRPDAGALEIDGHPVTLADPHAARAHGIAVIHQHPALFPDLDVVENIFAGHLITGPFGVVDWKRMRARAGELVETLGVSLQLNAQVRELSMAQHQLIEIAKALSFNAKVLVMDEPTAALTPKEVEDLFGIARRLKESGVALLFISHRLEEVYALCDRVTVLRDGAVVASGEIGTFTQDALINAMVGRELKVLFPKAVAAIGEPVMEIKGFSRAGVFKGIDIVVRSGEIVALTGLVGAGRTEVARAVFGVDRIDSGELLIDGARVSIHSPADAMKHGIAYVPEDRHRHGLIMDFDVVQNVSLAIIKQLSVGLTPNGKREYELASSYAETLKLRAPSLEAPVSSLSGGNQQKVVLSKWLAAKPRVLILDEPTRGVDVGTKAEVHKTISELAGQGMAILMISSEMPEVLGMADRIYVMHEGEVSAEFSRDEATQEKLMYAAAGYAGEGEIRG